MRLFFAVHLSDAIRQAVDCWVTELRGTGAHVRWVPAENMHVTLKFLGDIPDSQVPALQQAANEAVRDIPSFPLSVTGSGVFPPRGTPRVLWVGIHDGAEALHLLAERLNGAMEPLAIARDAKPFRAHLTVGRVKSPKGMKRLIRTMEQAPGEFGAMTITSVALVQSVLHQSGAEYTTLQSFELTTKQ